MFWTCRSSSSSLIQFSDSHTPVHTISRPAVSLQHVPSSHQRWFLPHALTCLSLPFLTPPPFCSIGTEGFLTDFEVLEVLQSKQYASYPSVDALKKQLGFQKRTADENKRAFRKIFTADSWNPRHVKEKEKRLEDALRSLERLQGQQDMVWYVLMPSICGFVCHLFFCCYHYPPLASMSISIIIIYSVISLCFRLCVQLRA